MMSPVSSASRPAILILFEYPTISGGELSMLTVLEGLKRSGEFEFILAAPESGPLIDEFQQRNFHHIPVRLLADSSFVDDLRQIVKLHDIRLVHANSLSMSRRLGRISSEIGVPCTGHLRDIIKLKAKAISDLNSMTALVAVSEATRQFHISQGIDTDRIETIYNGVDSGRFQPRPSTGFLKRELGLTDSSKLALNVGQICLRKGHDTLAEVTGLLRDTFPELHWIVCGERYSTKAESIEFEAKFHRVFAEHGISRRLHCLGFRQDISAILNEVDLLIHTARQEPLGRVLLEAAASGRPIVATNVGGTPEILKHEFSALLVPPDSPELLAHAVKSILEQPAWAGKLAVQARQTILQQFSQQHAAHRLIGFWKRILTAQASA